MRVFPFVAGFCRHGRREEARVGRRRRMTFFEVRHENLSLSFGRDSRRGVDRDLHRVGHVRRANLSDTHWWQFECGSRGGHQPNPCVVRLGSAGNFLWLRHTHCMRRAVRSKEFFVSPFRFRWSQGGDEWEILFRWRRCGGGAFSHCG